MFCNPGAFPEDKSYKISVDDCESSLEYLFFYTYLLNSHASMPQR